ncbi:MAG: hypothetical protein AB7F96_20685 [Beijerinckiaceae bacterium]
MRASRMQPEERASKARVPVCGSPLRQLNPAILHKKHTARMCGTAQAASGLEKQRLEPALEPAWQTVFQRRFVYGGSVGGSSCGACSGSRFFDNGNIRTMNG